MEAKTKYPLLVAIDALAVELGIGKDGLAFTWEQLECVNRILAVHAHELAEKIRAEANDDPVVPVYDGKRGPVRNSMLFAANLIDPEVTE